MNKREKSQAAFERLQKVIPKGVNSSARAFSGMGCTPLILEKGAGDTITDVDGNQYIDYCCSWGALLLGHAHPQVIEAVNQRAALGTSFGTSTIIEAQIAEKVQQLMPSMEKMRFVSSGTEATMTAVRVARGFTGRDLVVKFNGNYHGHSDSFLVEAAPLLGRNPTSSSAGVPAGMVENTICLPYNSPDAFLDFLSQEGMRNRLAAVILEPVAGNMGVVPANPEWLQLLRDETKSCGALLIFDEVMSGFRVAKGGAQALYGIYPDLTCLAKIVGGGLPAACVGGRADVMSVISPLGDVYQAGTLSGNPLAMEAGYQTLCLLDTPGFYEEMERKANLLLNPIESFLKETELPCALQRVGSMFTLFFGHKKVQSMADGKTLDKRAFVEYFNDLLEKGIYIPQSQYESCFISAVHTDAHLQQTSEAIIAFLTKWAKKVQGSAKEAFVG